MQILYLATPRPLETYPWVDTAYIPKAGDSATTITFMGTRPDTAPVSITASAVNDTDGPAIKTQYDVPAGGSGSVSPIGRPLFINGKLVGLASSFKWGSLLYSQLNDSRQVASSMRPAKRMFVLGSDSEVWQRTYFTGPSPNQDFWPSLQKLPVSAPLPLAGKIASTINSYGHTVLAATGIDGRTYMTRNYSRSGQAWIPWFDVGGGGLTGTGPAITTDVRTGNVRVFITAHDRRVWQTLISATQPPSWTPVGAPAGLAQSGPAIPATTAADGGVMVVVAEKGDALYSTLLDGSAEPIATGWQPVFWGLSKFDPSVVRQANGLHTVFATSHDNKLAQITETQPGYWGTMWIDRSTPAGKSLGSAPSAAIQADGLITLLVGGAQQRSYMTTVTSAAEGSPPPPAIQSPWADYGGSNLPGSSPSILTP